MEQYKASEEQIRSFLSDMKGIFLSKDFDIKKNFFLCPREENEETMLALDYNKYDVIEDLKHLEIENYYQSVPDMKNPKMPDYQIFFIKKGENDLYIKVRIQRVNKVFCVSFHFAKFSHFKMIYE